MSDKKVLHEKGGYKKTRPWDCAELESTDNSLRIISLPGSTHFPRPGFVSDMTCRLCTVMHICMSYRNCQLPGPEVPNVLFWNLRSWKLSSSWRQFGVNRSIQLFLFRGFPHRFSRNYFIPGSPDNRSTLKRLQEFLHSQKIKDSAADSGEFIQQHVFTAL